MNPQIITGETKIAGIIGNPVKHSISPAIHNHLFRELNLPFAYIPLGVERESLENLVTTLRAINSIGANVTIPYKEAVLEYCDEISDLSKLTGTVNTLYFKESKLCGTTTDYLGFSEAVARAGKELALANVVIIGNGGTARTIAIALANEGVISSLSIVGRNRERVKKLANEVIEKTNFPVDISELGDFMTENILDRCDLLVNCTPVGMSPNIKNSPIDEKYLHAGMFVFDAIYNPVKTKLLQDAEVLGCKTENGLAMLLYQGLASFEYWTGIKPKRDLISPTELLAVVTGEKK